MSISAFATSEQLQAKSVAAVVVPGGHMRGRGELIMRRGTLEQGRALETLGHAVEYLIDTRLFEPGEHNARDEQEAVQILMRMSRAVFAECPEVMSMRKKMRQWVWERLLSSGGLAEQR